MHDMLKSLQNIKPRILLVDNDPDVCESYKELLKTYGYDPIIATGIGASLRENALKKAEECRCSLALIDLRLRDDDDDDDMSGAEFAKTLRTLLHPILLTGAEDPSTLRKLLQDYKEIPYLGKQDRRDEFLKRLDAEASQFVASKRQIEFIQPNLLDEFLKSDLIQGNIQYSDQVVDVLARLFPNATTLRFEKVSGWDGSSEVSSAVRPNSIVLKVYEDRLEPCIIKLARANKIRHEINSYYAFISRKLTGNLYAQMIQNAVVWDIGGTAYSFISGNSTRTFSAYYKDQPIHNIQEVLKSFFQDMWGKYYNQATAENNKSLFELYSEVWGQDWYEKCLGELPPHLTEETSVLLQKFGLPDPIEWLNNKNEKNELIFNTKKAITHGDLHGDNLMVDDRKNVWVIDFERCGSGHILQDFIELEADVLNRLLGHPTNTSSHLRMYLTVFKPTEITSLEENETFSDDADIEKALKTISTIREFAVKCTGMKDAREYLYGLLFNLIFRAQLLHKIDSAKSGHPLFLAGLICHHLDHWDQSWPPIEWNITEMEKL